MLNQAKKVMMRSRKIDCALLMFALLNFVLLAFALIDMRSSEIIICPSNAIECIYD